MLKAFSRLRFPGADPIRWGAPMGTNENPAFYDRIQLRYPRDLTDEEWALIEPMISPAKRGGKPTVIMREAVNGVMYILSTGCQWLFPRTCRREAPCMTISTFGIGTGRPSASITPFM